ncbi:hypothetical protein C9374_004467 [Naegleria lovaniensis]|uniref:Uncharacterized protein n=1 Tax=Naegleria lovaniensis TaxID=51637 RepID=A0AA88GS69_NAELO|nr:uncharacterized protein C9374_004467 [Naegleria lovaniensis]KAG2383130.1 hypothetical protein C9374_004467 [Naegleria lovaniensis]
MKRSKIYLGVRIFLIIAGLIMFGIGVTNFVLEITQESYSISRDGPLAFVITQHLTAGALTVTGLLCFFFSILTLVQDKQNVTSDHRLTKLINATTSDPTELHSLQHQRKKQRIYNFYCSLHLCFWIGLTSFLLISLAICSLVLVVQLGAGTATIKPNTNKESLLQVCAAALGVSIGLCLIGCVPMYLVGVYLINIFRDKSLASSSDTKSSHELTTSTTANYVLISARDNDDDEDDDDDDAILLHQNNNEIALK